LVYSKGTYPKPWYDDNDGLYPVFHVFKGLSALRFQALVDVHSTCARDIQAIGAIADGMTHIWIANLTGSVRDVKLPGSSLRWISVLDESNFVAASQDPDIMDTREHPLSERLVQLSPYSVARLRS
jgi:hypothetical protein